MMLSKNYPVCFNSFTKWYLSNAKWNNIYNSIGLPKPFDVSMRDGFQGLSQKEQELFSLNKKIELYNKIVYNHFPKNIEIGSIVSEKILPIFKDTIELNINLLNNKLSNKNVCNNFILIPNVQQLLKVIYQKEVNNFSFITSVSESFQKKNTKMSLQESDKDLVEMMYLLDDHLYHKSPLVKLYVSCINECPIEGKIDNNIIIERICDLYNYVKPNKLCLSDTCGTLNVEDFVYIVDNCYNKGVPYTILSLHLHVQRLPERELEVEKIFHKALDRKINEFDVSILETGGCSVTIGKNKLAPNMSYEQYYKFLVNYIIKNAEK